jgi:hypothetical protein
MNRPIKFRAWDTTNKRWFAQTNPQGTPLSKHFLDLNGWLWDATHINSQDPEKNDSLARGDFALSQFTGLLDKNGKEIYEGDVVVYADISGSGRERKFRPRAIVWQKDVCAFNLSECMGDGGEVEVIGNIYESPELLTNSSITATT